MMVAPANKRIGLVAGGTGGHVFPALAVAEELQRRGYQFTSELKDKMLGRPGSVALQIMIDHHGLDATPAQLPVSMTSSLLTLTLDVLM